MIDKKGDTLTMNVIIVAALALIVLVVLIMIFTGRIGIFQTGLEKEGQAELIKMKITYGSCKPSASLETSFSSEYAKAGEDGKANVESVFKEEISRCKDFSSDKATCESAGCRW